jgi:hypothetical protein
LRQLNATEKFWREKMQTIDTNMLYLGIGGVIALVLIIGLLKSDRFKATVRKGTFDVDAGKNPEKHHHSMEKIDSSKIDLTQKDGHQVEMKKIKDSKIKVTK